MRKLVYLGCVLWLFVACERPLSVLDADDMAVLLADIHMAEATMGSKIPYTDFDTKRAYYASVFEKHNTSHEAFNKSLDWYAHHPKQFEEVYAKAMSLVVEKQEQIKNYAYHPEENPEFLHLIDSVDLWVRPSKFVVNAPNADSVYFELNDPIFFRTGDKYIWHFLQKVTGSDTLPQSYLKVFVQYPNNLLDSVSYCLPDKGIAFRYTVTLKARDSIAPQRVFGWFYTASLDSVKRVDIDSISFVRFFNKSKHPLDSSLVDRLNLLRKVNGRDSLKSEYPKDIITEQELPKKLNKEQVIMKSRVMDNRIAKPRTR